MSHENCETCGAAPPVVEHGPFAWQHHSLGYCALCSKDLCDTCLKTGRCRETPDHKHREESDCGSCLGTGTQNADGGGKRKCLDCAGTGTVLK